MAPNKSTSSPAKNQTRNKLAVILTTTPQAPIKEHAPPMVESPEEATFAAVAKPELASKEGQPKNSSSTQEETAKPKNPSTPSKPRLPQPKKRKSDDALEAENAPTNEQPHSKKPRTTPNSKSAPEARKKATPRTPKRQQKLREKTPPRRQFSLTDSPPKEKGEKTREKRKG